MYNAPHRMVFTGQKNELTAGFNAGGIGDKQE